MKERPDDVIRKLYPVAVAADELGHSCKCLIYKLRLGEQQLLSLAL